MTKNLNLDDLQLPDLDELDADFVAEWEDLKRQLRDLKEEQKRAVLVPTLSKE